MPHRKRLPALTQLQGIVTVLDNRTKRPPTELLNTIREMVQDAIVVLQEPDHLKQRLAFVLTAIRQSTEIKTYNRQGKEYTVAKITDPTLYHWAIAEVHQLAGAPK